MRRNILLLLGTTVGAGIFSLPLALQSSGIVPFFLFAVILGWATILLNEYYLEICASVKGTHQMPGYVRRILGWRFATITAVLLYFSTLGALYGFLILATGFLSNISGLPRFPSSMILLLGAIGMVVAGRYVMEQLDLWITQLKMGVLLLVLLVGGGIIFSGYSVDIPLFGIDSFSAFGVLIFAFNGFSIIPAMNSREAGKRAIQYAGGIVLLLYLVFAVVMLPFVTLTSSSGVSMWSRMLYDLAGLLAVVSPFLLLFMVGADILREELHVGKFLSFFITLLIPTLLFAGGIDGVVQIFSLTGGVFLSALACMIVFLHRKQFPKRRTWVQFVLLGLFVASMGIEVWSLVS